MATTDELIEQCKAVMSRDEYDAHHGYHPEDELTEIEYLQYLQNEQIRLAKLFSVLTDIEQERYWKWRRENAETTRKPAAWPAEPPVKIARNTE